MALGGQAPPDWTGLRRVAVTRDVDDAVRDRLLETLAAK
jgi:hypothetical protein